MSLSARVSIVEVAPRDGLQNEKSEVSIETRVRLINGLADAGLTAIEAGSFVSPRWVPQMAGTAEVLRSLAARRGVSFPVLVPNSKGLEAAIASGAREVAVFAAASETFSQRNLNCSIAESIDRFRPVLAKAGGLDIKVRGYVSCALGCPFEGAIAPDVVASVSEQLFQLGCYQISLGDTIGVGTVPRVEKLLHAVTARVPVNRLAVHFHDTFGQALPNILIALQCGISTVDSAVAGLGGCPYAPGATGNVATEDVLYMLHGMGIKTGVNLEKVASAGRMICQALGRETDSRVARALEVSKQSQNQACFLSPAID